MTDANQNSETLIRELLATGTMNPETIAELEGYLAEAVAGTLHPDDADYLVHFHNRIMAAHRGETPVTDLPDDPDALSWQVRAEAAESEVTRLKGELDAALARISELEEQVVGA